MIDIKNRVAESLERCFHWNVMLRMKSISATQTAAVSHRVRNECDHRVLSMGVPEFSCRQNGSKKACNDLLFS